MSFKDVEIKQEYRSFNDNMVEDFYYPLLSKAKLYERAVGFFSSTALIEISKGISGLVENGGKIRLIASPKLSGKGYSNGKVLLQTALIKLFWNRKTNMRKEGLICWLIW